MVNISQLFGLIEAFSGTATSQLNNSLDMAAIKWHEGEIAVHRKLNGPHYLMHNPTSPGLAQSYADRVAASPLVAFGALDKQGRPWTTLLGGEAQFTQQIAPNVLGVQSLVDVDNDPVVDAFFGEHSKVGGRGDGVPLRYDQGSGPIMAGLSIDLETRDRVKMAGRMLVGAVSKRGSGLSDASGCIGEMQLAFIIQEALGNCPKYLNRKHIRPHVPQPRLMYDSDVHKSRFPQKGIDLVRQADLFFLSSTNNMTMDTNYRGGPPGFLRIAEDCKPEGGLTGATGITLVYPEYSGNQLYQTLGNLHINPLVGLVVPDFITGDVLYVTGHTKTLVGPEASAYLPHTKLAVLIAVDRAIVVADGLSFRGSGIDYSPYNPSVRPLRSETAKGGDLVHVEEKKALATAVLTGRHELSPTVARFTLDIKPVHGGDAFAIHWQAGQYLTLDFGPELDAGWSHMRDDDPQSLNDDFIRTFTISSPPPPLHSPNNASPVSIALTLRRHGPATGLLWRQNLRAPLELPVLAFGGEDKFRMSASVSGDGTVPVEDSVFVAAGVGITPLLAQAPGLLAAVPAVSFRVLWSLRVADIAVAVDSFERMPRLAEHTTLFITGGVDAIAQSVLKVQHTGASIVKGRRINRDDVVSKKLQGSARRKIHICTGQSMLQELQASLPKEDLVWESFAF